MTKINKIKEDFQKEFGVELQGETSEKLTEEMAYWKIALSDGIIEAVESYMNKLP